MNSILTAAIIVLFVILMDQRQRLRRLEQRLSGLKLPPLNQPEQAEEHGVRATASDAAASPLPSVPPAVPVGSSTEAPDVEPSLARSLRATYERLRAQQRAEPEAAAPAARAAATDAASPAPSRTEGAPPAPPPVMPAPPEPAPEPARRGFSFSFEDLFGRQLPIWAGGITLAVAGVLIVKYAIDAGLLTPWIRIVGGLLFGGGLIAGAELVYRKDALVDDPRVRQALSGAGIATLYATILMAHNGYGLIGPVAAFVAMAAITAAALWLSLRFGAPSALLGLAGGLATPALVGSMQPNVPLLAIYLALTIGGLTAVSRRQKWMWIGLAALAGGGIWSLILIATAQLDFLNAISLGALVMILAILLPLLGFDGPRNALLRAGAAIIGAAQIALLVASGGYTPLHWALFIMIALAIQWLALRFPQERAFALAQATSAVLAVQLLMLWPHASVAGLFITGGLMLLIHAVPLYPQLWLNEANQPVAQWAGMGLAIGLVAWKAADYPFAHPHVPLALASLAALAFTLLPVAAGWERQRASAPANSKDIRLPLLAAVAGLQAFFAAYFALPIWAVPVAGAVIAAALLELGNAGGNRRTAGVASAYAVAAFLFLLVDGRAPDEGERLAGADMAVTGLSLLRWGAMAAMAALFALRHPHSAMRGTAAAFAMFFTYAALAQVLPPVLMPLIAPVAIVTLAFFAARRSEPGPGAAAVPALAMAGFIAALWAFAPAAQWAEGASQSLYGFALDAAALPPAGNVFRQLAIPAALTGLALWLLRARMKPAWLRVAAAAAALAGVVALHILYRHGFAGLAGDDFVRRGMAQRTLWAALLLGAAWALWRSPVRFKPASDRLALGLAAGTSLYLFYYSFALHYPMWSAQAAGPLPLANLLLPTAALILAGLGLTDRMAVPMLPASQGILLARILDMGRAMVIILFSYATLAQAFHGSLFNLAPAGEAENILRSILAIALAIGFLLWGIRKHSRDWRIASLLLMLLAVGKVFLFDASGLTGLTRIASFVALGFSLIGIGWLYSRQLRSAPRLQETEPVGTA